MLCHFLIGIPASGKSTFAKLLVQTGDYKIISTDTIRQQLYDDEIIQGNWLEIEAEVIKQIQEAIASQTPVIYDATNAKRAWRLELLKNLEQKVGKIDWLGWYLDLDLKTCKQWNSQRTRQVPDDVIDHMAQFLQQFPPHVAEGFVDIKIIKNSQDYNVNFISKKLNNLSRSIINRKGTFT
jgi:predicted kinase